MLINNHKELNQHLILLLSVKVKKRANNAIRIQ